MPKNINGLSNQFRVISDHLINKLSDALPKFDQDEFFQVFGKKLEDNLSQNGKNIYANGLDVDVLTDIHSEVRKKFTQDYEEVLAFAKTEVQKNFDPIATVNLAQKQLNIKLENSKKLLLEQLNNELAANGQEFTNPADKKGLNTVFINYLNQISEKYHKNLPEIEAIGRQLVKYQLHISNEQSELKNSNATFSVKETDFDKLSIGAAPTPVTGFKVHKDNLSEQLMYTLAYKKNGEKINIELTVPDRAAISRQLGEIGLQHRNPAIALLIMFIFLIMTKIFNDEERVVKAIKKVIEEKGNIINPNDITLTTKRFNNNGKPTIIRQKAALNAEQLKELEFSIDEIKKKLQEHPHSQIKNKNPLLTTPPVESGNNSDTEEEEVAYSRPRGP